VHALKRMHALICDTIALVERGIRVTISLRVRGESVERMKHSGHSLSCIEAEAEELKNKSL
jgi:hypothetical protein